MSEWRDEAALGEVCWGSEAEGTPCSSGKGLLSGAELVRVVVPASGGSGSLLSQVSEGGSRYPLCIIGTHYWKCYFYLFIFLNKYSTTSGLSDL